MSNRKLSPEQEKMILTLDEQGLWPDEIAKEVGCSTLTVYYKLHPERYNERREKMKRWSRIRTETHVGTYINGKLVFLEALNKRQKPEKCEICEDINDNLAYHHWDHSTPSHGMWVCYQCHMLIESWERGGEEKITKYLILKEIINEEMAGLP